MKENHEMDEYGNITFGEASKLLIDIIGENVILWYVSKNIEDEKDAEKKRSAFKQKLVRMYKGQAVYHKFATAEPESPQWYIEQLFTDILEKKYGFSHLAMIIIDSFTWQLFYALKSNTPFEKPKKETALFLVKKQVFNFIYYNLIAGKPFSDGTVFKISGDAIIKLLNDSYDEIFSEMEREITYAESFQTQAGSESTAHYQNRDEYTEKVKSLLCKLQLDSDMKSKKSLHGEIENYFDVNADKYPRLDSPEYRQNIDNWCNESDDPTDPTWRTLEPIFDLLNKSDKKELLHRLIGLYLLKKTQKAVEDILHISLNEQDELIKDIKRMISENKKPEEFYYENDFEFLEQVDLIYICLVYQHQEYFDMKKSDEIIKVIDDKCPKSRVFFSTWLTARSIVLAKCELLRNDQDLLGQIINTYRKAYDEGIAYAGCYLSQFLLESIIINSYSRNIKDTNDFYGYGYALELFEQDKQNLLNFIKAIKNVDPCKEFIDVHYSFNLRAKFILQCYPNYQNAYEFNKEAIKINNKGLEFEKSGDFISAAFCFSEAIILNHVYVNAYSNRGNVYNKISDDFSGYALADFNTALLLDPKHENTLFNRGSLLLRNQQFEKAIIDFTEIININPNDSEAYLKRGVCYVCTVCTDNLSLALTNYNRAIEINPSYAEAYIYRSVVYKLLGESDKARYDLLRAKQIDPEFFLKGNIEYFGPLPE